jgi:hypothetical protein
MEGFLHRPIVFREPERTVHPPSWLDYTPFAFWIVDALRPATFVELGCHSGNSYASFAQAVEALELPTICYGVDTWRGDPHAGYFDETVFDEWSAYHNRRFSGFSQLLRATFDEALEQFSDGSIDLLHIDGYHTFDAVKHDFNAWRPKLSDRGVILCHDIAVRDGDFGAWRLWERLKNECPTFELRHGHGLGVIGVGNELPEPVRWLLSLSSQNPEQARSVRAFFSRLGAAVLGRYTATEAQNTSVAELAARDERLAQSAAELERLRVQLDESCAAADAAGASAAAETERLQSETARLRERIDSLTAELHACDEQFARTDADARRTTEMLEMSERQLASARAELRLRVDEVDRLASDVTSRDAQVAELTSRLAASARALDAAQASMRPQANRIALSPVNLGGPQEEPDTIVIVSHVGPWRPRAGNEYRLRRMLQWYQRQGYRIILVIAPLPGEELPREGIEDVAAFIGNVIQVHRDGAIDYVVRDVPDVLASLKGSVTAPLPEHAEDALVQLDRSFCHDALISTVLPLERSLGPHILQVEYIWMSRLLPMVDGDVLKVIDTIDVFSSIEQKVRMFGLRDVCIQPHEEAARLRHADLVIAIQADEHAELTRLVQDVQVITTGVDFDIVPPRRAPTPGQILCVASGNPRNRKGLQDFVRIAWPRIQRYVPGAEFVVVGDAAAALAGKQIPGVTIAGRVEDLADRYAQASLVINPVVAGTGIKIKTLEALCHLRPVVTWPAGVEGLDPDLAALCVTAHDWYDFSEQVIALLKTPHGNGFDAHQRARIATLASPRHVYASLDSAYRSFFERQLTNAYV